MEISEIVNNLLDTINRPNDDVWVKRATAFVIQSFNRLGQKLLYEPLELQITADTLGEPTDNYIILQKAGAYPQAVYSEKLKQFLDIKFLTEDIITNNVHQLFNLNDLLELFSIEYFVEDLINFGNLDDDDMIELNKINTKKRTKLN